MDVIRQLDVRGVSESGSDHVRSLIPHWNYGLIAASIGISLLGAFTSTQLMCQARLSKYLSGVLVWSCLASLTFGFCSIWCLHFVAMLACELDLPIGLNVPLTILSAILAVSFTFAALASDLSWDRYRRNQRRRSLARPRHLLRAASDNEHLLGLNERLSIQAAHHLTPQSFEDEPTANVALTSDPIHLPQKWDTSKINGRALSPVRLSTSPSIDPLLLKTLGSADNSGSLPTLASLQRKGPETAYALDESGRSERNSIDASATSGASTEPLLSRRSSAVTESNASSFGLGNMMSLHTYKSSSLQAKNVFVATAKLLYLGTTWRNAIKGLLWSFAVTSMHYMGILALRVPGGYISLHMPLVILSAVISWIVCSVGAILMAGMEKNLSQQFLFSVVATAGVAAMHFTGMAAATFYSSHEASRVRGYPPQLAAAITTIAIITCLSASYLLAHSATVARNKLAEIVLTRRKLWAAIAQKENAEAATQARNEFIASASHEIRTPLHQLQGYGDLLARTELTEEGRLLLCAIQHATRSLSLITSNVLDWSRLEKGEAPCRPVPLDIRVVCESIVNLLPNREDETQAELMVVVTPTVPQSLFLDETYIHRILMNLLSNAMKFTSNGYVLLLLEMQNDTLVATVQDTGPGIPPSFLPDLFEPFKQAQVRGAQRGTGLGLSIIKQLLHKMGGTIDVASRHRQPDGNNGSTFVVKCPTQIVPSIQPLRSIVTHQESIAILPALSERTSQGQRMAWETYGFKTTSAKSIDDLLHQPRYVWTTVPFLKANPEILKQLIERTNTTVLVPYDMPDKLVDVPAITSTPHFVTLQRPLIWHRIDQTLTDANEKRSRGVVDKAVRFATEVDVMDEDGATQAEPVNKPTILLVEDNKINQKLGVRMLKTLGYHVLTADDGQEAIERILEHDDTIDAVLMDQSMPRKDGLTATSEIRMMEEDGTLSRRRPIIAVTAVVGPEAQAMCRDAGTDDFLPKPLSLAKLQQSLKHHLRTV
ncbi:hypothetical protein LTR70_007292 [Exophiala xenobiotica]|uniref:Histidine kinase n=1 Tax=Lithohypha guttulata TaxID=1690604 RepID=A0ABR0K3U9_9EURO|nr:hypothetical protein LTR24_007641 [Lithohypha guttulata]KAK5314151.1 hypothetical protein LTR70_007292 [Exophiala xenobiotica]